MMRPPPSKVKNYKVHDRGYHDFRRSVRQTMSDDEVAEALSAKPISKDVRIGQRMFCNLGRYITNHHCRFVLVKAIHRQGTEITGVEAYDITTRSDKTTLATNFPLMDDEMMESLKADKPATLVVGASFYIPNRPEFFEVPLALEEYNQDPGFIAEDYWPEILAREAMVMLYSNSPNFYGDRSFNSEKIEREGFTLEIPPTSVYSNIWTPSLPGGDFARRTPDFLSEEEVALAVERGNAHASLCRRSGITRPMPPYAEWNNIVGIFALPQWQRSEGEAAPLVPLTHTLPPP